jgi:hypothetical protein
MDHTQDHDLNCFKEWEDCFDAECTKGEINGRDPHKSPTLVFNVLT